MTRMFNLLLCLFLTLSLFTGCGVTEPEQTNPEIQANDADPANTAPSAADTLETERLTTLSWDSGRTESTSENWVAETESGLYLEFHGRLLYADKSDLSHWVAVCSDPNCEHALNDDPKNRNCSAYIGGEFILKDDRIYYVTGEIIDSEFWEAVPGNDAIFVASMALDGTGRQVEHIFGTPEDAPMDGRGGGMMLTTPEFCLNAKVRLNQEGLYYSWLNAVDENGEFLLYTAETESDLCYLYSWRGMEYVFGDPTFYCSIMDPDMTRAYMLKDRTLTCWDFSGLPYTGSNLSGDNLWCFRPGDGYYAIDLNTRAETRLADCQLEVSNAHIILRNCILESTMVGYASPQIRENVTEHSLRFYDGVQWYDVALPEEVKNIADTDYLEIMAVTSDRILLVYNKGSSFQKDVYIYQILLGTDAPALEYLGWYEDLSTE